MTKQKSAILFILVLSKGIYLASQFSIMYMGNNNLFTCVFANYIQIGLLILLMLLLKQKNPVWRQFSHLQ